MLLYRIRSRTRKTAKWLRGWFHACVTLPICKAFGVPIRDLSLFQRRIPLIERREFSQNGEDGILHAIFSLIGTTNRYYVEFGVEDGIESNTRYLKKHKGWTGLLMDGSHYNPDLNLQKEFITAENIETLFEKYEVPEEFDLLSIDIDGNDYWIWNAITHYRPRVMIVEYNACIPYAPAVTIPYKADFQWDGTAYYGASLSALVSLGIQKGYTLLCTDRCGVNAFFLRNDLLNSRFRLGTPATLYHPAAFKGKYGKKHPSDPQSRPWISVENSLDR